MPPPQSLLALLRDVTRRLDGDVSLDALARRAGWSPFHLHRGLRAMLGETPKRYVLRLRLARAAALLVATDDSVGDIAAATGFTSHSVFARAFRRRFGCAPVRYRATALADASHDLRLRHLELTTQTTPCIGLFRMTTTTNGRTTVPTISIERQERPEVSVLLIRRRTGRDQLAATIGECFGKLWGFAQKSGIAEAGRPTVRYVSVGPGLWTIEACKPVAASTEGEGDIESGALPAGATAVALHAGPYDELQQTYTALETWMEKNGYRAAGAPWEVYINDPAEFPDPREWRTEVCWPIAETRR